MSLFDLPDCFVELLDICWQVKVLYASVMGNELHAHLVCPQAPLDEIPKEVSVHLNKLSGEYATHIQILGVWLKGLVVAEDLGRACSGVGATSKELRRPCFEILAFKAPM